MDEATKTVGSGFIEPEEIHPLDSVKSEAVDRMKLHLLTASMDDPFSTVTAIQQVTMLRAYHQIVRIVQYLDLMDKLERKLYDSIEMELDNSFSNIDESNFSNITKLLAIQEKIQKSIVESNKLLTPYLDMTQYPVFESVKAATPISANVIDLPSSERQLLRENAGAILTELKSLETSPQEV